MSQNYFILPEETNPNTQENIMKSSQKKKEPPSSQDIPQDLNKSQNIIPAPPIEMLFSQKDIKLPPPPPPKDLLAIAATRPLLKKALSQFQNILVNEGMTLEELCNNFSEMIINPGQNLKLGNLEKQEDIFKFKAKPTPYKEIFIDLRNKLNRPEKISASGFDVGKPLKSIYLMDDDNGIICLTTDGSLRTIDLVRKKKNEHNEYKGLDALTVNSNGSLIFLANDESIIIIEYRKNKELKRIPLFSNKEATSPVSKGHSKFYDHGSKKSIGSKSDIKLDRITQLFVDKKTAYLLALSEGANSNKIWVWELPENISLTSKENHYFLEIKEQTEAIKSIAFFPEGNKFVNGTANGKINIWILQKKEKLSTLPPVHQKSVNALVVSSDGSQIISGGDDKKIIVWKQKNNINYEVFTTLATEQSTVSLKLLPDNRNLISGSGVKGRVFAWNIETGQNICSLDGFSPLALSLNGQKLCTAGKQNSVRIWNLTYSSMVFSLKWSKENISQVQITDDGKTALALGKDRVMRIWDLETLQITEIANIGVSLNQNRNPFAVFSDNNRVISLGKNIANQMEIWDINTGETLYTLQGHKALIIFLQVFNDNTIYSLGDDGQILRWELENIKNFKSKELGYHKASVLAVLSLENSEILITGGKDGSIKVWKEKPFNLQKIHNEIISSLIVLDSKKWLFSASYDQKIIIWDTLKWGILRELAKNYGIIRGLDIFLCEESWRLVSISDKKLALWNLNNFEEEKTWVDYHENSILTAVSAKNNLIFTGCMEGNLRITSLLENENEEGKYEYLEYMDQVQDFVILDNNSQMILTKKRNVFIKDLKDFTKETQLLPIKHENNISSLAVSLDNKQIITAEITDENKPKLFLWSLEENKFIKELEGFKELPKKIQFFHDSFFATFNPLIVKEQKGENKAEKKKENLAKLIKTDLKHEKFSYFDKEFTHPSLDKMNALKLFGLNSNEVESRANENLVKIAVGGEKSNSVKRGTKKVHGSVLILNNDLELITKISTKENIPFSIDVIPDGKHNNLICGNTNKSITIWSIKNQLMVSKLFYIELKTLSFIPRDFNDEKTRCLGFINNNLFDFETNKFIKINKWTRDKKRQIFALQTDEYLAIDKDFTVERYNNIFCTKNRLDVLSSMFSLKGFFEASENGQNNEDKADILKGEKVMFPYYFNILHLIAISGNKPPFNLEDLNSLNLHLDLFLAKDVFGNTCFDLLIQLNNKEIFKDFYYLLKKELDEKAGSLFEKIRFFSKRKTNANDFLILAKAFEYYGSKVLEELLNHTLIDYDSFCSGLSFPEMDKPIYLIRKNLLRLDRNKLKIILERKMQENQGFFAKLLAKIKSKRTIVHIDETEKTVISKLRCKVLCLENFVEINDDIINFLDNVNELDPSNQIFRSNVLNILANYKWQAYASDIQKGQFFVFMFFFALFCLNFFYFFPNRIETVVDEFSAECFFACLLDLLVFFYIIYYGFMEFNEFISRKMSYIQSGYNWIDIGLILISSTTLWLDFLNVLGYYSEMSLLKEFIAVSFFLFWLRVIIFLRGVSGTAFMITLIVQVVKDIRYFLLLIFLFLLSFNSSTYFLQSSFNSTDSFGFMGSFTLFYRLLLGDFNQYDDLDVIDSYFLWVVMLIFTLLLVIVLLNLLISIISDSFSKVFSVKKQARTYELLNLINAVDRSLSHKTREKLRQEEKIGNYLMVFYNTEEEKELDLAVESHNLLKQLNEAVAEIPKKLEENFKNSENMINGHFSKIKEQFELLKKMKDESKKKK